MCLSSNNNAIIVSGSFDDTVKVRHVASATCTATLTGHESCVKGVSISAGKHSIVSGSNDKTVRIWDVPSGTCIMTLPHWGYVNCVSISSDEAFIVTGCEDTEDALCLWLLPDSEHRASFAMGPVWRYRPAYNRRIRTLSVFQ